MKIKIKKMKLMMFLNWSIMIFAYSCGFVLVLRFFEAKIEESSLLKSG